MDLRNRLNSFPLTQQPLAQLAERYSAPTWTETTNPRFDQRTNLEEAHGSSNEQRSLLVEPFIDYSQRKVQLWISSRDRDLTQYPSPTNFRIKFDKESLGEIKNVESIQLLSAMIPASSTSGTTNVGNLPFVYLTIKEIQENLQSTNAPGNQAFTVLQIGSTFNSSNYVSIDEKTHRQVIKEYSPQALAKLSSMTISLSDPSGTIVNLGTEGNSIYDPIQTYFLFEVKTRVKNTKILENRASF